jgi:hypothetical protein
MHTLLLLFSLSFFHSLFGSAVKTTHETRQELVRVNVQKTRDGFVLNAKSLKIEDKDKPFLTNTRIKKGWGGFESKDIFYKLSCISKIRYAIQTNCNDAQLKKLLEDAVTEVWYEVDEDEQDTLGLWGYYKSNSEENDTAYQVAKIKS